MSARRRRRGRRERTTAPMSAAGLLAFFEEEGEGFKMSPMVVIVLSIALTLAVIMARLGFFTP